MNIVYPQNPQDSAEYLQSVHPLGHKLHYTEQRNKELQAALKAAQLRASDAENQVFNIRLDMKNQAARHHEMLMQARHSALQAAARLIAELAGFEVE